MVAIAHTVEQVRLYLDNEIWCTLPRDENIMFLVDSDALFGED